MLFALFGAKIITGVINFFLGVLSSFMYMGLVSQTYKAFANPGDRHPGALSYLLLIPIQGLWAWQIWSPLRREFSRDSKDGFLSVLANFTPIFQVALIAATPLLFLSSVASFFMGNGGAMAEFIVISNIVVNISTIVFCILYGQAFKHYEVPAFYGYLALLFSLIHTAAMPIPLLLGLSQVIVNVEGGGEVDHMAMARERRLKDGSYINREANTVYKEGNASSVRNIGGDIVRGRDSKAANVSDLNTLMAGNMTVVSSGSSSYDSSALEDVLSSDSSKSD